MKNSKKGNAIILHFALLIFIFFTIGLLVTACGKKEVKKVSEESKIAQEAFRLAETLRYAYVKNDRAALQKHSTKEGYRELIGAMKRFDSVELTFTPRWVEVEDSTVYLNVTWKGTWIVTGKQIEERGMAIFVLEENPLKLSKVLRANPFRQPE